MNASFHHLLRHQRILLLQGKMGTFFCRFGKFLSQEGKVVKKINLNAGDEFFYCDKQNATAYRGDVRNFYDFLSEFIQKNQIDAVVCFNDCRPHHSVAKDVCTHSNTAFFVFEEGYLRPDYITLQEHGINGYSQLDISTIDKLDYAHDKPAYTDNRFWRLCLASIIYYAVVFLKKSAYPHYRHYRGLSIWQEAAAWLIAPWRKLIGYLPDKSLQRQLTKGNTPYFLVALQVHNDSQISHHSDYPDVEDFICEVMTSFAKHAAKDAQLVFKHHPLDRGHRNYRTLIDDNAQKLGLSGRVFYGCDMHLPSLIKGCQGFVTINSTTALQAIYHKKPTKITGRALYDLPKLSHQGDLDGFWTNPTPPDHDFYLKFREYLIEQTQLNGSFYGKSPWKLAYRTHKTKQQSTANHS